MNKPFWSIENDYFDAKRKLEKRCERAKTLFDAVRAGANGTYLISEHQVDFVGYLDENGALMLEDFTEGQIEHLTEEQIKRINVKFDSLGEDGDGYTVAYFQREN